MSGLLDKRTGVVADTAYCDNVKVAQDVNLSLPPITWLTADVQAMGTMTTVIPGLIEDMEATINYVGLDFGMAKCFTPKPHEWEFRGVQNVLSGGEAKAEGFKAYLTAVPKGIPSFDVEPASAIELALALAVTRYQLYVGGQEVLCIDRLNQVCRINGEDYWSQVAALL